MTHGSKASTVAAIQMNSNDIVAYNLAIAEDLIAQAVGLGAKFVCLPENFALMSADESQKLSIAESLGNGPIQQFLSDMARQHNLIINGGTIPIKSNQDDKVYACSPMFNTKGELAAHYMKIHLFDVTVDDGESYTESSTVLAGDSLTTYNSPLGCIGMSVCYDLRFPELYRRLLHKGTSIYCVPAAFTYKTGMAHWQILLRARAVENLSYVIAPNQSGTHPGERQTYGHSMIVSPWGDVLAECSDGETNAVITADIDQDYLAQIRQRFPATQHIKLFQAPRLED